MVLNTPLYLVLRNMNRKTEIFIKEIEKKNRNEKIQVTKKYVDC